MANEKDGAGPVDKGKAKATDPPKKDDVAMKDAKDTKDVKGEPKEGWFNFACFSGLWSIRR